MITALNAANGSPLRQDRLLKVRAWAANKRTTASCPAPASGPSASIARPPVPDQAAVIAEALREDRQRIRGILESPEAVGRESSARDLAFSSGMPIPQARQLLSSLKLDGQAEAELLAQRIAGYSRLRKR